MYHGRVLYPRKSVVHSHRKGLFLTAGSPRPEDCLDLARTTLQTAMAGPSQLHVTKLEDLVILPSFLEPLLEPNSQGRPKLHGLASACRALRDLVRKEASLGVLNVNHSNC